MKKILLVLPLSIFLSACTTQPDGFEIQGKLTNSNEQKIFLEELTPSSVQIKDAVKIDKDGEFTFSGKIHEIGFYRLRLTQNNFVNLLLDTLDNIQITADARNLRYTYKIEGTENAMLLYQLNDYMKSFTIKEDSLRQVIKNHQSSPDLASVNFAVNNFYRRIVDDKMNFVRAFVGKYHDSFVALAAIEHLDQNKDLTYFTKVDKALYNKYPNSRYVKNLHTKVLRISRLAVGAEAPEIILNDPDNNPVALSSLRGKVVLIDFWASWCKPCRIENPNLVKIFNKYHSKGFEIFGVSLDKSKASWEKAIIDDNLTWIHVSDLGYWNSPVAKLYDITSIPQTYLIDENGIIIAKGLRGLTLENKLEEILG